LRYWFRVTNENRKRRKNIVGAGFVPALLATLMVACKKTEDGFIEEKKMKLSTLFTFSRSSQIFKREYQSLSPSTRVLLMVNAVKSIANSDI